MYNIPNEVLSNRISRWLEAVRNEHPESYGCTIPCALLRCNADTQEVVLRFYTGREMENPWGVTHGGMLALILDYSMGITARTTLNRRQTPTVSMNLQYMRPVPLETTLHIRCRVNYHGKTIAYLEAEAWNASEEKLFTKATGVYYLREQILDDGNSEQAQ